MPTLDLVCPLQTFRYLYARSSAWCDLLHKLSDSGSQLGAEAHACLWTLEVQDVTNRLPIRDTMIFSETEDSVEFTIWKATNQLHHATLTVNCVEGCLKHDLFCLG